MKTIFAVLCVLSSFTHLQATSPCRADPPPGTDRVGLYTMPDGTGYANINAAVNDTITVYLCLTRCSETSGVSGWECSLEAPIEVTFINQQYYGFVIGGGYYPNFSIGLAAPLPQADVIPLVALKFQVNINVPAFYYLHPSQSNPTIPGQMIFVQGNNVSIFHQMFWSSGEEDCAVFGLNTGPLDCNGESIVIDNYTWGGVKAMYR